MTVNELIDRLSEIDGEKQVFLYCTFDSGSKTAGGSRVEIFEDDTGVELWNDES